MRRGESVMCGLMGGCYDLGVVDGGGVRRWFQW